MSLLNLALAYVWNRKLVTALTVLSVSLGTSLILLVLNIRRDVEAGFLRQAGAYDLVCGAMGSETALVLCGLFHADRPRGNVSYRAFEDLQRQPGITAAYPFALGDQAKGARIVGTTREFLEQKRDDNALFPLAQGRLFDQDLELVAGVEAARKLGLTPGSKVVGAHSIGSARSGQEPNAAEHGDFPYTVVGVLAPTGTAQDRALFTTLGSYWKIHEKGAAPTDERGFGGPQREITVALLRVQRPSVFQIQAMIPKRFGLMAVRPAQVLQDVFREVLEPIEQVALLYGYAVVGVAAASVLTTLYLTTIVRRRDVALLRVLGASPSEIFTIVLFEAAVLLILGCGVGVLLSQFMGWGLRGDLEGRFGLELSLFRFTPAEVYAVVSILALGLLAALVPAAHAYRSDLAELLGRD
jgi:putative ABC transport system permease protein